MTIQIVIAFLLGMTVREAFKFIYQLLRVKKSKESVKIPSWENDTDGFNCVAGKDLDFVNEKAYLGTAEAHYEGGVPNMTITIPERTPYYLGQLFYFFEKAVAISGNMLGVNPFNQPGVEAYKKKMFKLLGKS